MPTEKAPNPHILNQPYDILALIFEELDLGSATCLGLTCRPLYNTLKVFYPSPIDLAWSAPVQDYCWDSEKRCHCALKEWSSWGHAERLGCILAEWFGDRYRISFSERLDRLTFLDKAVYGIAEGWGWASEKEAQLMARYEDASYKAGDGRCVDFVTLREVHHPTFGGFPSPFNLGDEWDDQALEIIRKECQISANTRAEREFWKSFNMAWRRANDMAKIFEDIEATRMEEAIEDIRFLGL